MSRDCEAERQKHKSDYIKRRERATHQIRLAKDWLLRSIVVVGKGLLSLDTIEHAYSIHCEETGQKPIIKPILGRLILNLFQDAVKRRLGPRRKQRAHYKNLSLIAITDAMTRGKPENGIVLVEQKASVGRERKSFTHISLDEPINLSTLRSQFFVNNVSTHIPYDEPINLSVSNKLQAKVSTYNPPDEPINLSTLTSQYIPLDDEPINLSTLPSQYSVNAKASTTDEKDCDEIERLLNYIIGWCYGNNMTGIVMERFDHSASCKAKADMCSHLCNMFKLMRRHLDLVTVQHPCPVLEIYASLITHHGSTCKDSKCVLRARQEKCTTSVNNKYFILVYPPTNTACSDMA